MCCGGQLVLVSGSTTPGGRNPRWPRFPSAGVGRATPPFRVEMRCVPARLLQRRTLQWLYSSQGWPSTGQTSRASVLLYEPNPFALAITNVQCSNPALYTTLPIRSTAGMRKTRRSGAKRYPSSRAYPQGACFACGNTPPTLRNTSAAKKHLHLLTNGAIYAKPRAPWTHTPVRSRGATPRIWHVGMPQTPPNHLHRQTRATHPGQCRRHGDIAPAFNNTGEPPSHQVLENVTF